MSYSAINQFSQSIKELGFQYQKDILGFYYTKTTHRFSIMKHGHLFICYHNVNMNNQWRLKEQGGAFTNYLQAIQWVYERAKITT